MKNKGFTLIELLAVIVILAIIALIAVPIILNIIKDSKRSSDERSIELYGKAIEQAVAKEQLNGYNIEPGDLNDEFISEKVEYKGSRVKCGTSKLNTNGTVYLANCKVDNKDVDYTYGEEEKSKGTYAYMWYTEDGYGPSIGGDASNLETSLPANPDNTNYYLNYYLKFKLDETKKVTEAYACVVYKNKEKCVRGGSADYFADNTLILKGLQDENNECYFTESYSSCDNVGFPPLSAYSDGRVYASADIPCFVFADGRSYCGV